MRLKRLDIFAFKSFMDRTSLSFPTGLSAIVGPNGCGKSNIIDAIRWVIGEQSARSLRGRLMEDVIFAGTHGRRPLGLTEVSLTLEPANGHPGAQNQITNHPVFDGILDGAAEVTITRRLHRSGDSEFLLNRRPCRLKDIAQLFLGTGAGGRGYGVIEQGKVEQTIDQRPEERRLLVEEAAGVSRYRLERAETLRKLAASEANLTRLSDVLGEIERQLSALERQRRQAERHAKLRERLSVLELAQAARGYLAAELELAQAHASWQALATREQEAAGRKSSLAAEKARIEAEAGQVAVLRQEAQERFQAARQELAGRQARASALGGEIALLRREGDRLEAATLEARRRAEQAEGGLARCADTCQQAGVGRATAEAELTTLPQRIEQAAAGLESLREAADRAKGALIGAMAARSEAANALRAAKSRQAELTARLARKEQEVAAARGEAATLEERRDSAKDALTTASNRLGEARAEEQRLEAKSIALKRSCEELGSIARVKRAELEGLRSHLAHLEGLCRAATGEAAEGLANTAREMGVPHFLLAEALEIDEALEPALGAALGERLRAVVFARAEDARAALERHHKDGRGVALALAADLTETLAAGPAQDTGAGGTVRLREGSGAGLAIGTNLNLAAALGRVGVAADMTEALAGATARADGGVVLTRDGAALLPGGWLVATGKEQGSSLLTWQREVRGLARRASELEREVAGAAEELKAGEAEAGQLAQRLEQARRVAREEAQRLSRLEADSRQAAEKLTATRERLRLSELEATHAREAKAEVEAQVAQVEAACLPAQDTVAQAEAAVAAATAKVREAERAHTSLAERLATAKATLAALNEREAAARAEAERLGSQKSEAQAQAATLATEAAHALRRMTELNARLSASRQECEGLSGGLRELENGAARADSALEGARQAAAEAARRLAGVEAEVEALRDGVSEGRLARSELALKVESVTARARELHDIDLAPQAPELAAALPPELDAAEEARRVRESLLRLGEVNPAAPREHEELKSRHRDLLSQSEDVRASVATLRETLERIDRICRKQFMATFESLNDKIGQVFTTLFGGGTARLELVGDDPLEAGVDIIAQPPGKRLVHMSLLSGGEKAMAATALLFALHLLRPSPFYLLDELDAALDDSNVQRLNELLKELASQSQLIVVTHNKQTLEMADTLYGVTMQEPGVSKLVSVRLSEMASQGKS